MNPNTGQEEEAAVSNENQSASEVVIVQDGNCEEATTTIEPEGGQNTIRKIEEQLEENKEVIHDR